MAARHGVSIKQKLSCKHLLPTVSIVVPFFGLTNNGDYRYLPTYGPLSSDWVEDVVQVSESYIRTPERKPHRYCPDIVPMQSHFCYSRTQYPILMVAASEAVSKR